MKCNTCGLSSPEVSFPERTQTQCLRCLNALYIARKERRNDPTIPLNRSAGTLENLAILTEWATVKDVARHRGLCDNAVRTNLNLLVRHGYAEVEYITLVGHGRDRYYHQFRRTTKGTEWLGGRTSAKKFIPYATEPDTEVPPNLTNPFIWRTYVQPYRPPPDKWGQQPRPDQKLNTAFTQYP